MKRFIAGTMSVLMCFSLISCGKSDGNKPGEGSKPSHEETGKGSEADPQGENLKGSVNVLTFEYAEESAYYSTLTTQKKNFEDAHPDVKIEYQNFPYGEYENQLRLSLGSGGNTDIVWLDAPYIASYASSGALQALDEYWAKDEFNKLVDSSQQAMKYKDNIYAAPLNEAAIAIYYNVEMFEEAGINPPKELSERWTWEELYDLAKKLTVKNDDGTTEIYGISPSMGTPSDTGEGLSFSNMAWMWEAGGQPLSDDATKAVGYFDSPEIIEALTFYQKLHTEGLAPLEGITNAFPTGKVAMIVSGPWETGNLNLNFPDFKYDTTPLPIHKEAATPTGSWNVGIPANSDNKDAAWAFIETLVNEEGSKLRTDVSGDIPAVVSVLETSEKFNQDLYKPFKDEILSEGRARPVTPVYPEISELLVRAFSDVAFGADPTETAKSYAQQMQSVLDKQ